MMREHLTPDDISNLMGLERDVFDGVFVVVEGITDLRLYGKFIDKGRTRLVVAHSRDNAERSVREMSLRRRDRRVIGIVDSDLDLLDGKGASPPLFHTDLRDLEMMTVAAGSFDDVLAEYGDAEKIAEFEGKRGSFREAVVSASYPIGLLMRISRDRRLGLSFKELDFRRFVNPRTVAIDEVGMVDAAMASSRDVHVGRRHILGALDDAMRYDRIDPWDAARGHDTVAILLVCLRSWFGGYNSRGLTEDELSGALRLAYSDEDFRSTELFSGTSDWAAGIGEPLWDLAREGDPRPRSRSRTPRASVCASARPPGSPCSGSSGSRRPHRSPGCDRDRRLRSPVP